MVIRILMCRPTVPTNYFHIIANYNMHIIWTTIVFFFFNRETGVDTTMDFMRCQIPVQCLLIYYFHETDYSNVNNILSFSTWNNFSIFRVCCAVESSYGPSKWITCDCTFHCMLHCILCAIPRMIPDLLPKRWCRLASWSHLNLHGVYLLWPWHISTCNTRASTPEPWK